MSASILYHGFRIYEYQRQGLQMLESKTQKILSVVLIFGRLFALFITASCWRRARF